MGFFFRYLKEHLNLLALFFFIEFVYTSVFFFYSLPFAAFLYPDLLCAAAFLLWLGFDIAKARRKHTTLTVLSALPGNLQEVLTQYPRQEDEDYRKLITLLVEAEAKTADAAAEKMNDCMDYYTAWVHQIKTPIASMRLSLQNEDSPLSRRLSEDLFRIEQYVEMVLTYLRLDDSASDYVFRACALDGIIKAALRKFAGQFIRKGIRLSYTSTEKTVLTDEKWLTFVLEQVLSNALKYTERGEIRIFCEGDILSIQDTGIGIAPEDLPRIFEKGYTGFNGRRDQRASGLGLYLCRRICANLGHGIHAVSAPELGTTIQLDLSREVFRVE